MTRWWQQIIQYSVKPYTGTVSFEARKVNRNLSERSESRLIAEETIVSSKPLINLKLFKKSRLAEVHQGRICIPFELLRRVNS